MQEDDLGGSENELYDDTFAVSLEDGEALYTYAAHILEILNEKGFGVWDRPILEDDHAGIFPGLGPGDLFDGRMPTVLKRLSLDQLSSLFTLFCNWHAYVISVLTGVSVEYSEAVTQKELIWSMVRVRHKRHGKRKGVTISDQLCSDLAREDRRFIEANSKYLQVDALKKSIEALSKVVEANMKVISREVTVRGVQTDAEARSRGMGSGRFTSGRYIGHAVTPEPSGGKKRVANRSTTKPTVKSGIVTKKRPLKSAVRR